MTLRKINSAQELTLQDLKDWADESDVDNGPEQAWHAPINVLLDFELVKNPDSTSIRNIDWAGINHVKSLASQWAQELGLVPYEAPDA